MRYLFLIALLTFTFNFVKADDLKDSSNFKIDSSKKEFVLIGNITLGRQAKDISAAKVEAAFNLACILSQKYINIPLAYSDSLAKMLKNKGIKPKIETLADSLQASQIVFIRIDKFEHVLRAEISMVKRNDINNISTGDGFSLLHFMKDSDTPLYDPTLLQAIQRAFAVAEKDSTMYAKLDGDFKVFPANTLVIGGLEYIENEKSFPKWEIFENKVLTSYDAVETIFKEAKNSSKYVTFDVPTRDSIYALFGFYIVENYKPATSLEIESLMKFDVANYLAGEIKKVKEGAEITLNLYAIKSKELSKLKSVKGLLVKDDIDEFRKVLTELVKQLIE